jgi:hypothetical protein
MGGCEVTYGSAGLRAMLEAFQRGSGLCGSRMAYLLDTLAIVSVMLLTALFLYGQYRLWRADSDNGDMVLMNCAWALGFSGLFVAILLS